MMRWLQRLIDGWPSELPDYDPENWREFYKRSRLTVLDDAPNQTPKLTQPVQRSRKLILSRKERAA